MSHEPDTIYHPFSTETLEDHVTIHVDNLPQTTITESQSGRGFVVHCEGVPGNGTHTSIRPASLYREASQLIATARAMEAETLRRNQEERRAIRHALAEAGLSESMASDLHAVGLRATRGAPPRTETPADTFEARAAYMKGRPDTGAGDTQDPARAEEILRENVGQTIRLLMPNQWGMHARLLAADARQDPRTFTVVLELHP